MKRPVIAPVVALVAALSLTAAPVMAQGFSINSVTPTLDFPDPKPEPVSQGKISINK